MGYCEKVEPIEQLRLAVEKVANQLTVFSRETLTKINSIGGQFSANGLHKKLSKREIEILRFFCKGLKNHEIATELGLHEKTISTYKKRLLTKLPVKNLIEMVNFASKHQMV